MRKKEENKGITLVSLVVTIIVLIILAGVSINLVLGENGILEMAKRAKENIERTQLEEQERLNELYKDLNYEEGEGSGGELSYDIIAKLNEFKKKIADYIEEAGGIKPEYTANVETFGERIKGIVANVTKETNAEEPQILIGYKAYSKGKIRIGSMANQGAKTTTLNAGTSYTIPKGYHNGQGVITAKDLASQTVADATADNITEGKTAWVNGELITGNGADNKVFLDSGYKVKTGKVDLSYGRSWTYKYFDIDYSDMGFKSVPYFGAYTNVKSIGIASIVSINNTTCRFWAVQYGTGTGEGCYATWVVCGK